LTLERKLTNHLYTGLSFRAITNSYARSRKETYWRMDENLVGAFIDVYLNKHLVLPIETGHSVLRRMHTTVFRANGKEKINLYPNDNWYVKMGIAYRIRLK
jgi:hypothetical protein